MIFRRYLIVIGVAVIAALVVFFIPRVVRDPGSVEPTSTPDLQAVSTIEVPWPSAPSASPITSAEPTATFLPEEPSALALLEELNAQRQSLGLSEFYYSKVLSQAAERHAHDMAARSYLSHESPEGVTFQMRIDATDFTYSSAGENLGFASHISLIVPDWLRSEPHRLNIVNPIFRAVGIATARGTYQDIDVEYVVAVFAQPR